MYLSLNPLCYYIFRVNNDDYLGNVSHIKRTNFSSYLLISANRFFIFAAIYPVNRSGVDKIPVIIPIKPFSKATAFFNLFL